MRAVNRTGCPAITAPKSDACPKTTTRPDISSAPSRCSVARNISRPRPNDCALSPGVTVTGAAVPNAALIGWRATASERSVTASPNPTPTTPIPNRPALITCSREARQGRHAA
jgi:hypothetical protein